MIILKDICFSLVNYILYDFAGNDFKRLWQMVVQTVVYIQGLA